VNTENLDATAGTTSRKELLKKIGVALTAASIGSLSSLAGAAGKSGPVKLGGTLTTALSAHEGNEYCAFIATGRTSSIACFKSTDTKSISTAITQLGVDPARTKIVGGILQVNLGAAADGVSNGSSKLNSFSQSQESFTGGLITR
jgi:hypothetical protein